jgi:hypothetical protein
MLTGMLVRAMMDSHYGKPEVITRACREVRTVSSKPDRTITKMPDNRPVRSPYLLALENSRLVLLRHSFCSTGF